MTALRRAAVVLTQAQQDQIKTFEKSGDTLDAQKVLLDALSSKFSGAAAAVATPSAKLRASLHTVTEEIGQFLIPGIDAASSFIAAHLPGALALFETGVSKVRSVLRPVVADVQLFASAIRAGFDSFGDTSGATGLAKTFEHIGGTIRTVYDEVVSVVNAISEGFSNGGALQGARGISATLEQLGGVIRSIAQYVEAHWKPILIGVGAALLVLLSPVVAVTAALVLLYARSQTFRDVIATIAEFITADVVPALGQLADFFTNKVVPAVELVVGYMSDQFSHLVDYVRANWTDIQKAISNVLKAIEVIVAVTLAPIIVAWDLFHKQILATLLLAWKQVQNIVDTAIRIVRDIITVVLALLSGDWGKAWNALKDIPAAILTYVGKTLQIAFGVLEQLFSAALALLGTAWSLGWDALKSAVSALISWVVGEIKALPGQLLGLITGIASAAASIGGAIFHGIGDIIAGLPNLVTGIAKDAINGVIGLINDFIRFLDGLSIGIPKVHVPGTSIDVGGGSVGFPHIPTIPTLGAGGTAIAPGVAVVGDKGPELIHMPIGATVVPLDRPSGPGINVEHLEVNGADKPAATANEVVRSLRKVAYLAGR
jgi:hypothetical protein